MSKPAKKIEPTINDAIADDFARKAPIGTDVKYYPSITKINFFRTKVRSKPTINPDGSIVVSLKGMASPVDIRNIKLAAAESR